MIDKLVEQSIHNISAKRSAKTYMKSKNLHTSHENSFKIQIGYILEYSYLYEMYKWSTKTNELRGRLDWNFPPQPHLPQVGPHG